MNKMEVEQQVLARGMPSKMIPLLEIPQGLEVKKGDGYIYYFKGGSFDDPYLSLSEKKENVGFVDYLFGFKEDFGRLYVILIDKTRKVAILTCVANFMENRENWEKFGYSLKSSIRTLNGNCDHVEFTLNQPELIYKGDERSWK